MKILLINTDDYLGGAAVAALRLKKALEQRPTLQITMLVQESRRPTGVEPWAKTWWQRKMALLRFGWERLYFSFFEKSKAVRYAFSPANTGVDISQHPLVQEADIIHLHWINFGFLSLQSLQKLFTLGKPVVWTLHDMWAFTGGCHHSGDCELYRVQCGSCKFLKNTTETDLSHRVWEAKRLVFGQGNIRVITCSNWLGQRAKQSSLFKTMQICTIPNPIDTDLFCPKDSTIIRQQLRIPTNKKLILFAAMKVSAVGKGFAYFEKALKQLKTAEVELLIFGNADEELLQNLPFPYHYLGKLNEAERIAEAYQAADIFVIPSLEENLPNTIMESLACGTPVVGFSVGGIPEMIAHQHNGYVAKYKSVEDLADGMAWVLEHQSPETLSQNARHKVEQNYAEAVVAQQYAEVYGV